jgi:hypothetical protein
MNYKGKKSSKRKFRYLRRGWNVESEANRRNDLEKDFLDKVKEYLNQK